MPGSREHPIDLNLWRRQNDAPENEMWKWDWENTWDPVFLKYYSGEKKLSELECPVCGRKKVYAYFLTASARMEEGRRVYIAERWFGCHACQTQLRDRGPVPPWMKDEEIVWATEGLREMAERKLDKNRPS